MSWGTLCPEELTSVRRQQDLDLASAVRHFNDRAVPGLGGLWFPMPLVWSVLAVALTEKLGLKSALPVGNAIEALVMSHAKVVQGAEHKGRIRGSQKLQSVIDPSFKNLSRPGVYVVQPIRMAMVQPLVELGFVTGGRYGGFRLAEAGHQLMRHKAMDGWFKAVEAWAYGKKMNAAVLKELSPLIELPQSIRKLIADRVLYGRGIEDVDAQRRRALARLGEGPSSDQLLNVEPPSGEITESHWTDIRAGAAFMDLRNAAMAVLSAIEEELRKQAKNNATNISLSSAEATEIAKDQLEKLKTEAGRGRSLIDSAKDPVSMNFVKECLNTQSNQLVVKLAKRDGSVIKWLDDQSKLIPGPAWTADEQKANTDASTGLTGFAPQLYRLWNLHCLMNELNGNSNPRSPGYPSRGS
jgi:hypothetical protein